jgi:hypothetical protein
VTQVTNSIELLERLRAAHLEVLNCIAEMEQVTREPGPDVPNCTAARFRISRASLERRALWQKARRHLQGQVTAADSEDVRLLATIDLELGTCSADHVRCWTVPAIRDNWAGYQATSHRMRQRMADCIEAEKRILYPLLGRYA